MTKGLRVTDPLAHMSDAFGLDDAGCWIWVRGINAYGYGVGRANGRHYMAHRLSYELLVGEIPDGLDIDHLCRVRACVNPDHLEPVDRRTNLLRGETINAVNAAKTHCPQGHEYSPENTGYHKNAKGNVGRTCRACARGRARVRAANLRELRAAA